MRPFLRRLLIVVTAATILFSPAVAAVVLWIGVSWLFLKSAYFHLRKELSEEIHSRSEHNWRIDVGRLQENELSSIRDAGQQ